MRIVNDEKFLISITSFDFFTKIFSNQLSEVHNFSYLNNFIFFNITLTSKQNLNLLFHFGD